MKAKANQSSHDNRPSFLIKLRLDLKKGTVLRTKVTSQLRIKRFTKRGGTNA